VTDPWSLLAHDRRQRFQILGQCRCCARFVDGVWKAAHTTLCDDCHSVCQSSRFVDCRIVRTNLRGEVRQVLTAEEAIAADAALVARIEAAESRMAACPHPEPWIRDSPPSEGESCPSCSAWRPLNGSSIG